MKLRLVTLSLGLSLLALLPLAEPSWGAPPIESRSVSSWSSSADLVLDRSSDLLQGPNDIRAYVDAAPACSATRKRTLSRFQECYFSTGSVSYFDRGLPKGEVHLEWTRRLTVDWNSGAFTETDQFRVARVFGDGVGAVHQQRRAFCASPCSISKVSFAPVALVRPGQTYSATIEGRVAVPSGAVGLFKLTYVDIIHRGQYDDPLDSQSTPFRCDATAFESTGCVFSEFIPTLSTMASLPGIRGNIVHVQQNSRLHPGSERLGGNPLTRTTDSTKQSANYRASCPRSRPRPTVLGRVLSCDEYPFASTLEGGASYAPPNSGWAWVPVDEQRSQGGYLSSFYRLQRVLDGDKFWVEVGA